MKGREGMDIEDIPDDWYFEIRDLTKDLAINTGFNWTNFYFRGFNGQGDGAVFDFDDIDIAVFIKYKNLKGYTKLLNYLKKGKIEINFYSEQNNFGTYYYHEKTRFTNYNFYYVSHLLEAEEAILERLCNSLAEHIENERLDICLSMYRALKLEWERRLNE